MQNIIDKIKKDREEALVNVKDRDFVNKMFSKSRGEGVPKKEIPDFWEGNIKGFWQGRLQTLSQILKYLEFKNIG